MISINGYVTYTDWAEWKNVEIDETKIRGFQLDYRGGREWFVIVHPKKGEPYEVEKGTSRRAIHQLLKNPKARILKIVNYHNNDDFMQELGEMMK